MAACPKGQRIEMKIRLLRDFGFKVCSSGIQYEIAMVDAGHPPKNPYSEFEPPRRFQVMALPTGRLNDRYAVIPLSPEWTTEKQKEDALRVGWCVSGRAFPLGEIGQGIVDAMLRLLAAEIVGLANVCET